MDKQGAVSTPAKASGLKPPSKILRPSGVPSRTSPSSGKNLWEKENVSFEEFDPVSESFILTAGTSKPVPPEKAPGSVTPPVQDGNADFKIGERVWVSGNKPGYVHFVGGTQFAPGQWAGIVLDEPIGKNDGSVAGVRYFQCEDGRGIFTRPSKLSRTALPEKETNGGQASPAQGVPAASEATPAGTASAGEQRLCVKTRRA